MPTDRKWTPGPWKLESHPGDSDESVYIVSVSESAYIGAAHLWRNEPVECWSEADANANLIAAAPDLYEALEALITTDEDCGDPLCDDCATWRPARAAIAKARGEQP